MMRRPRRTAWARTACRAGITSRLPLGAAFPPREARSPAGRMLHLRRNTWFITVSLEFLPGTLGA
eukprot:scaffold236_cov419-Prasinococcus_capsulatus_cf.AAC.2